MREEVEWHSRYDELRPGDIFVMANSPVPYTVLGVNRTPGGGVGQGEYPPIWVITTNRGVLARYDPWVSESRYIRFNVIGSDPKLPEAPAPIPILKPEPKPKVIRF